MAPTAREQSPLYRTKDVTVVCIATICNCLAAKSGIICLVDRWACLMFFVNFFTQLLTMNTLFIFFSLSSARVLEIMANLIRCTIGTMSLSSWLLIASYSRTSSWYLSTKSLHLWLTIRASASFSLNIWQLAIRTLDASFLSFSINLSSSIFRIRFSGLLEKRSSDSMLFSLIFLLLLILCSRDFDLSLGLFYFETEMLASELFELARWLLYFFLRAKSMRKLNMVRDLLDRNIMKIRVEIETV